MEVIWWRVWAVRKIVKHLPLHAAQHLQDNADHMGMGTDMQHDTTCEDAEILLTSNPATMKKLWELSLDRWRRNHELLRQTQDEEVPLYLSQSPQDLLAHPLLKNYKYKGKPEMATPLPHQLHVRCLYALIVSHDSECSKNKTGDCSSLNSLTHESDGKKRILLCSTIYHICCQDSESKVFKQ